MRPKDTSDLSISWAIRDIPADIISKDDRAFLFILLSIIGNNKSILRTISQFSQKFGISCRAISRTTKSLSELKFIQIIRPYNQGRGQSNEYFLNYENIVRASKLIHKHDYMASLTEISSPIGHALNEISSPNLQKKHALLANHRYIKKEIKEERESALSVSFFEPDEANIILAKDLSVDLDENLNSFRERHKGNKTQYEFGRWLKKNKEYVDSKKNKQHNKPVEAYSAVNRMPFFESTRKSEEVKRDLTMEPVKIEKLLPFREQLKINQQRQGSKPNGKDHSASTTGNKGGGANSS